MAGPDAVSNAPCSVPLHPIVAHSPLASSWRWFDRDLDAFVRNALTAA